MNANLGRVVLGGALGTLIMTAVGVYVAPRMGMPPMNPADMLAMKMGGSLVLGWMGHMIIGVVLGVIYAKVAVGRLPGAPVMQGALFSVAPWLLAQVVVMPMMGMGLFSGSMQLALGSLVGHLMFGAVLGGVVGARSAVG
jgi:uncharacterized membrane protein YagU involved in acid resistance